MAALSYSRFTVIPFRTTSRKTQCQEPLGCWKTTRKNSPSWTYSHKLCNRLQFHSSTRPLVTAPSNRFRILRLNVSLSSKKSTSRKAPTNLKDMKAPDLLGDAPTSEQEETSQVVDVQARIKSGALPEDLTLAGIAKSEGRILFKKVTRQLASLPLAIGELSVIAALCAVGTVIEQEKAPRYYFENYPMESPIFGFVDYNFILSFGVDHIYSTWYFLGLLALLGASLAACSSTTQWPMVKAARRWRFLKTRSQFESLEVAEEVDRAVVKDLAPALANRGYQVFVQGGALYGFKGLVGRLAPIGVHVALLFILLGTAYSSLATVKGTVMAPQDSDIDVTSTLRPNSLGFGEVFTAGTIHVNEFNIDTYNSGAVSQFYSDLSVVSPKGEELYRKTISVNDPFRYDGVTMYQTDWSISSLVVSVSGGRYDTPVNLQLPMASLEGKDGVNGRIWATFLPTGEEGQRKGISLLARDLQSVVLYKEDGEFAGVRRPESGKEIEVGDIKIVVKEVIGATGLELKKDPGVPFVYAGYGGLIITTFISYLSHSQVWALENGSMLYVGGRSNRAKVEFSNEIDEVLEELPEAA